jgi:Family of unknown function (DUF6350)
VTEAPPGADRSGAATTWRSALRHGTMPLAAVLGLGVAVAALRAAGRATLADALRQAALVPALVHRVPVEVGPITVRLALLLATAAAGWLLFRGGRAVASGTGAPAAVRAIRGAAVAVPYAVGSLLMSLVATWASPGPVGSAALADAAVPSILGSFTWPLLLGAMCGAAGGMSAGPADGSIERRARATLGGGWRMAWLSVALGTTGVLVVLALHPGAVRAYLDGAFQRGPAAGAVIVVGTVAALPNAGTGAAAAAMGAGVELEVLGVSCTVISYTRFPREGATGGPCGPFAIGSTPAGYLLFLLVPMAGTVAGGRLAARRGGAEWGRDGGLIGAAAGFTFAVTFAGLCVASRLVYEATGPVAVLVSDLQVAAGADPVAALLVGLIWGPAGGAVGGWWTARPKRTTTAGPDDPGPARDVGKD